MDCAQGVGFEAELGRNEAGTREGEFLREEKQEEIRGVLTEPQNDAGEEGQGSERKSGEEAGNSGWGQTGDSMTSLSPC